MKNLTNHSCIKKNEIAGYRVHLARFRNIRAKVSAVRTHKFLCEIPESGKKDLKEKFEKIAKIVDSAEEGSLLWFLIQMYGLGFCIARTPEYKRMFLKVLDSDFKSPSEKIKNWFDEKNTEKTKKVKSTEKLLDFLMKDKRNATDQFFRWGKFQGEKFQWEKCEQKNLPTFVSDALPIFGISNFSQIQNDKILKQFFEKIFSELSNNKNNKEWKFGNALKKVFADFFEIPQLAEIKKEDTTTFFFNPFIWKKNGGKIEDKNFEIFSVLFENIFPTAMVLSENIDLEDAEKEILGVANKQGGLSNFLNEALSTFQKSEDDAKELIRRQNELFFQKNQELLDFLAKKTFLYATKIPKAESYDFLAKNWAEYRGTQVGGRLEGWVSNFKNRLKEFQIVLADSIHEKELNELRVPEVVRSFLLEKQDDGNFVFKNDLPKDFEQQKFPSKTNLQTGEILKEQELLKFYFWKELKNRRNSISCCTKNILKTIRENSDFENVFPEDFRSDFENLERLCDPLLKNLRTIVFGASDENQNENLGKMIDEYSVFWKSVNEFLQKWANEGIPEIYRRDGEEIKISIWDNVKKNPDPKPEKYWIAKSCLVDAKGDDENEFDYESEFKIVGKWKKESLIPRPLPKYPRFLYEAAKNPKQELEIAAEKLPNILQNAEKFVSAIEIQKNEHWEAEHWKITVKKGEIKWHFGAFHKSLEALLKIAIRSKKPRKIISFLDSFVEWDDAFFENLKTILGGKNGFDAEKERMKIESTKAEWKNVILGKRIETEKLTSFHFYLSGKEYGFARYGVVPTKAVSITEFLTRFEAHFELQRNNRDFKKFLEIEDNGVSDNSSAKVELLKFWWARRIQDLADRVSLPDFPDDNIFSENVLKKLVFGKMEISRIDAQRFLMAGFGADLRGKIGLLSRKSFIARNVVQITNGEQTLLQFVPREWGEFSEFIIPGKNRAQRRRRKIAEKRMRQKKESGCFGFSENAKAILREAGIDFEDKTNADIAAKIWEKNLNKNRNLAKVLAEMPHSWNVILKTKQPIEGIEPIKSGFFLKKSEKRSVFNLYLCAKKSDILYAFPIRTSVVQKQFFERFLWGDCDEVLTEKIMGPSMILEIEKIVKWKNGIPNIEDGETNMFIAIPFEFSKEKTGDISEKRLLEDTEIEITNANGKSQKQYRCERNILGIDLGEYGFGFAVFNPNKKKFETSGFVEVPYLRQMREDVANWRDTQSFGIFSRPTTHLANIREKATGAVRNQIHALALKYDAIPIYEDSVDGFEAGGSKISKLYKTIKSSDVISRNVSKADNIVRGHIWGISSAQIGGVIGAAKTSQTCRKCGRCATAEIRNLPGDEIEIRNGKIVMTDDDGVIWCDLPDGKYLKRDVEVVVKSKQRRESLEEKAACVSGKRRRGTIEEFECQICKNVTDCDEQAAKNIVLKYFFKITATEKDREEFKDEQTGAFSSLKYFLKKSREKQWINL